MPNFGKSKAGGRRSAPRAEASLVVVLFTVARDYSAWLTDLSRTGARLGASNLPAEGEDLIFKAENVQAFGHVIWSEPNQCGVAFETPIAAHEVQQLRALAKIEVPASA